MSVVYLVQYLVVFGGLYPVIFVSFMQIRGMHTLVRDSQTTKHDFVFYADRLIRLVCIFMYLD